MPLTLFHLGPGLFLGVLAFKFFNIWAIALGSIIADIEPLILLIILKCYHCPHHGFFHSFLGSILGSLILALFLWKFKEKLDKAFLKLKIKQSFSFRVLFFSSLTGWLIHILFDSLTHFDVFPFWPIKINPFLIGPKIYWLLNLFLLFFIILFFILIYARYKIYQKSS